ncbi:unnamed protein product [Toxocara canis]|uniref:RNase H domain-containing protein n=1 Tax=Toxocara canis TaxID=6265 RepID=A0A183UAV4_TOXCA|nr:unnamed protein product [Toxocara canis]
MKNVFIKLSDQLFVWNHFSLNVATHYGNELADGTGNGQVCVLRDVLVGWHAMQEASERNRTSVNAIPLSIELVS